MRKDFIETLRINKLSSIPPYDASHQDKYRSISVGKVGGRYGILKDDGTEFLPFEYDNITVWGFGLLQLSLNGKLGLLHIKQEHRGEDFYIAKLIACEYDVIKGRQEGVVFLGKYGLPTDFFCGCSVRTYLTKPELLTDEYAHADIMSTEPKRGLISLSRHGEDIIVSTENGKTLSEMSGGITFGSYDTDNATVLLQEVNGSSRLLYIGEDEIKEYAFDGENAYAVTYLNEDGKSHSVGFIVEEAHGLMLLDEELYPMFDEASPWVVVNSEITAVNRDGYDVIYPFRGQHFSKGNIFS